MDEKLKETLKKIVQLSKQNREFDKELRKALGIEVAHSGHTSDKRIDHIEKYLGLDYHVDEQPSLIDYSFISDTEDRHQLISDNREMMRFRYGTRYHKIRFDEFCRYAHLQAEMLLNYFYRKKDNNNIKEIVNHIKKYNEQVDENVKTLGAIPYAIKLYSFSGEFKLKKHTYPILNDIRKLRNESSHRIHENEEKSILVECRKKLEDMNLPLDRYVDTNKIKNPDLKKMFENYNYFIWLHAESFDGVIEAIENIKQIVQDNI